MGAGVVLERVSGNIASVSAILMGAGVVLVRVSGNIASGSAILKGIIMQMLIMIVARAINRPKLIVSSPGVMTTTGSISPGTGC